MKEPGAADNECVTTLSGALSFYETNARCLNTPFGLVVFVTVKVGPFTITAPATAFASAPSDNSNNNNNNNEDENRNWRQDKKLSAGEIGKLHKAGIDIHDLKGGARASQRDLYKDREGNIYVKPKDGQGPGDPTGLNINKL